MAFPPPEPPSFIGRSTPLLAVGSTQKLPQSPVILGTLHGERRIDAPRRQGRGVSLPAGPNSLLAPSRSLFQPRDFPVSPCNPKRNRGRRGTEARIPWLAGNSAGLQGPQCSFGAFSRRVRSADRMRTFIFSLSRATCSTTSAAGRAAGPDAPPERGEARDRLVAHRQDVVARLQPGLARRAALGQAGDDDRVLDLGGVEAEPGPRRPVGRP